MITGTASGLIHWHLTTRTEVAGAVTTVLYDVVFENYQAWSMPSFGARNRDDIEELRENFKKVAYWAVGESRRLAVEAVHAPRPPHLRVMARVTRRTTRRPATGWLAVVRAKSHRAHRARARAALRRLT